MTGNFIVFIGSYGFERNDVLKTLRQNGYKIAVVGQIDINNADIFIQENLENKETIIRKVLELSQREKIAAVISFLDQGVGLASYLSSILGLKGNTSRATLLSRNKYLCRLLMSNNPKIPMPKFEIIEEIDNLNANIFSNSNLVLKPIEGGGSKGVVKINKENFSKDKINFLKNKTCILEEFIDSDYEVSVEVLVNNYEINILGIHEKVATKQEPFLEEIFILDSPKINEIIKRKLGEAVDEIVRVMDYKNGGMHIEFLVKKNNVFLIEVNGRIGGMYVAENIYHKKNINIIEGLINIFLDKPLNLDSIENVGYFGFRTIYAKKIGVIQDIEGIDEIKQEKGTILVKERLKKGDEIKEIASDYVSHVLKKDMNYHSLKEKLKECNIVVK